MTDITVLATSIADGVRELAEENRRLRRVAKAAKEVIESWERAEDDLPDFVPDYNPSDAGWSQEYWLTLCKLNAALLALEEGK